MLRRTQLVVERHSSSSLEHPASKEMLSLLALLLPGVLCDLTPGNLTINYVIPTTAFPNRIQAVLPSTPIDFGWQLSSTTRGSYQTGYHLQVSTDPTFQAPMVCDTGMVASNDTVCVNACDDAIAHTPPFTLLYWRVSVTGNSQTLPSPFVPGGAFLRSGVTSDFSAGFVAADLQSAPPKLAPLRMRVASPPLPSATQALLYVASPAYWQAWSNGVRLDQGREFGPWIEFNSRVVYETYDVTHLLSQGQPLTLGFRLSTGPYGQYAKPYASTALPILLELHVERVGGGRDIYASSPTPSAAGGVTPLTITAHSDTIIETDWYSGEKVDGTLAPPLDGWDTPTYDPTGKGWVGVSPFNGLDGRVLEPPLEDPITVIDTMTPSAFFSGNASNGTYTWAFPRNFAGRVELSVASEGHAGAVLEMFAGEETDGAGGVHNQLLINMSHTWVLRGDGGVETVGNTFVFWGAQYYGVSGWPATMPPPTISSLVGLVTSTLRDSFVASHMDFNPVSAAAATTTTTITTKRSGGNVDAMAPPLLNATILEGVQTLITWSQRANWQSLPSDCPNREKHGWSGDGAVSSQQAMYNFHAAPPYRSWTQSMLDNVALNAAAHPEAVGVVSSIVPPEALPITASDAAWGLAVSEVPYQMLKNYGDTTTATRLYAAARGYFHFLVNRTDPVLQIMISESLWGDWDAAFPRTLYQPNTKDIGATSSHIKLAKQLLEMAPLVGAPPSHALEYTSFLAAIAAPFNAHYANASAPWTYVDGIEQTVTLLPLSLGLVPQPLLNASIAWLISDIETTRGVHLSTGSTGTRVFFEYLSSIGRTDLAGAVAAQDTFPSHGFWVTQGATTCWENWSGQKDDQHGNIPPTHNHIFLGSHSGWAFQKLLGIQQPPGSYGYASLTLKPPIMDTLPSMAGFIDTVRGRVSVAWAWGGENPQTPSFSLNATIPPNLASASVHIPVAGMVNPVVVESGCTVWEGGAFVPGCEGVTGGGVVEGGYLAFAVGGGGGQYTFTASPASSSSFSSSTSMSPNGFSGSLLTCPSGTVIAVIAKAGIAAVSTPHSTTSSTPSAALSRRYLMTHLVEGACLGRSECRVPRVRGEVEGLLAPAVVLGEGELDLPLFASALCAPAHQG